MKDFAVFLTFAALLVVPLALFAQSPGGGASPSEKDKAAAVERARTFLSKKLEVPVERLTLDSATAATWPDASLGCPEKDRMFAQVLTNGFKVLFKADGKTHEVRVAGKRVVSCERTAQST
ncbi:MAG TPA: hypothetical protein VGK32_18040 [Vicinamibacterales bacterium]|jgi:hypothetical protein